MGNSSLSDKLAWLWRKTVILGAKKPALASPLMCMVIVGGAVAGLATTPAWHDALCGSILSWAIKDPELIATIIVTIGRILFSSAAFIYFCRALQLCYPKYYDQEFDVIQ
jgi:hypothetical protein